MAESFCRMEMTEAVLDCCEMAFAIDSDEQEAQQQGAVFGDGNEPTSSANCGTPPDRQPPAVCTVGCAERWNPLVEDCAQYLTELQPLTEACEARAQQFLGEAPSTVTVTGLAVHHDDNGNYSIAPRTIGGKPTGPKRTRPPTSTRSTSRTRVTRLGQPWEVVSVPPAVSSRNSQCSR